MTILKKWTIAAAVVMIALLSSCQTNDPTVESFTRDYTVRQNMWDVWSDDSGDYFYYTFKEPNLTSNVYNNGVMVAYLLMNDGTLSPLPFNDYWSYGTYMGTEQVSCEFLPGSVTFILKYSDHDSSRDPYYDYTFRVRFMW